MKKEYKSQLVISVCKDIKSGNNYLTHLNASLRDIDWIIELLEIKREELYYNIIKDRKEME